MVPYVILGLPRCRTAWLARFLSTPERPCLHEPSRRYKDVEDLRAALADDAAAISDSMLTMRWRQILRWRPDCRIVVVHRPVSEVVTSAAWVGLAHPNFRPLLLSLTRRIAELQAVGMVLSVPFASLAHEAVCGSVYEFCRQQPMSSSHWRFWAGTKVEADVPQMLDEVAANMAGIRATYPELAAGA
ncbi:MAG TPA: hypothetical protein VMV33_17090 [Rhodocyclaceae bacterium]|nr:hypothetical protein [Rhodocyclaceae bacterium]